MARRPSTSLRLPASRRPVPTRTRVRTRRVPLGAYVGIVIVAPLALVVAAHVSGWWIPSGHTVPSSAWGTELLGVAGAGGAGGDEGHGDQGRDQEGHGSGGGRTDEGGGSREPAEAEPGQQPTDGAHPPAQPPGDRPSAEAGDGAQQEVRGSMTVAELLAAVPDLSAEELFRRAGVPDDTPTSTPLRDLMHGAGGLDVPSLRTWLAEGHP